MVSLEKRGYIVTAAPVLSDDLLGELAVTAERIVEWESIFVSEGVMDPYRAQASITDSVHVEKLEAALKPLLVDLHGHWRPSRWMFLKSIEGGEQQAPHRDFLNAELTGETLEETPGSCIIALKKNAFLAVYPWNQMKIYKKEEKLVEISPGHAIIFRGELIHCGTAYTETNYRVHCYLELDDDPEENATQTVNYQRFACAHCHEKFLILNEKKDHQKACTLFLCKMCPDVNGEFKSFPTFAGRHSHIRRKHRR